MRRKRNGSYWTVRYDDTENPGLTYDVGNWGTYDECFIYVATHPFDFPPGLGKIVKTR